MNSGGATWIGADPGGKGNFGMAILEADGTSRTYIVDCTEDAIQIVKDEVKTRPAGVGVDAPLWWSSGRSSDRHADQWLRQTYGLSGGQVQAANSLRGAVLVQGLLFVQRIRELFSDVGITETHPKALIKALNMAGWDDFAATYSVTTALQDGNEHKRDAIISAVAAREGFEGRWLNDLSTTRNATEQDPATYWLAPIHYFWPV